MNTAFTPGPWAISASAREYNNELMITAPEAGDNGVHVCQVTTDGKGNKKSVTPEQDANAQLIAAAPELLAALIALDNYVSNNLSSDYPTGIDLSSLEFRNASKAIAKATGVLA